MIDDKLWGITTLSPVKKAYVDTAEWPTEVRSCKICGRMATARIHPDAHAEWSENHTKDEGDEYLGVKVVKMALRGLCCDNCGTTRQMYLNSKEGIQAIAIELMRRQEDGESNLTEKQEVVLMAGLRKNLKNYCDALRRMHGATGVIFDENFVNMIWEHPKGAWRVLRAMQLFLYQSKPIKNQYEDISRWLTRMGARV